MAKNAFGLDDATNRAIKSAFDDGVREGRKEMKVEVLSFLENQYVKGKFPRKSPKAEAMLQIVADISAKLNR